MNITAKKGKKRSSNNTYNDRNKGNSINDGCSNDNSTK